MKRFPLALLVCALAALCGCDKPQDTLQKLQNEISAYASSPSDEAAAKIDADFVRLDEQITQVRNGGNSSEADALAKRRDTLQAQYAAARMTASLLKAKDAAASVGEAFRKAGEAFGQAIKAGSTEEQ